MRRSLNSRNPGGSAGHAGLLPALRPGRSPLGPGGGRLRPRRKGRKRERSLGLRESREEGGEGMRGGELGRDRVGVTL